MPYQTNGGKPIYNEFITPIGLITHCSHDKPLLKVDERTRKPVLDDQGLQEAEYRVTMAWEKSRLNELQDMMALARQTVLEAWPESAKPGAFFHLEPFFRDGDNPAHNTKKREYLFNKYYLNIKQKAVASRHPNGQVIYSGAPGLIGPSKEDIMPLDIYSGCKARCSGVMFGTEYAGRNFISTRLNNIQKHSDGERIGNTRPDPRSQFDVLPGFENAGGLRNVL